MASVTANSVRHEKTQSTAKSFSIFGVSSADALPAVLFLGSKLVVHTFFGLLLGWIGASLSISLPVRLAFQLFTALFLFATAMNLLQVHPIFRYVVLQPPRRIQRWIRTKTRHASAFSPIVLGALTLFIPCGVTQAVEVAALNTGDPVTAATLMFSFVLGTSPLFLLLGLATARLSHSMQEVFSRIAATLLILMAMYSANGVLVVLDAPITLQSITRPVTYYFSDQRIQDLTSSARDQAVRLEDGVQKVRVQILNNGYAPNYFTVQAGTPVQLTLTSDQVYSCALAFTFREFDINTFLDSTDTKTFTFTPETPGTYTFTCSMGMYTGQMRVL